MKYAISTLALMAATALGCGGKMIGMYITEPIERGPSEVEAMEPNEFKKDDGTFCKRSFYIGSENGQVTSTLITEHCIDTKFLEGNYFGERYIDRIVEGARDGIFETWCIIEGTTQVGQKTELKNECKETEANEEVYNLINYGTHWVLNP